MLAARLLDFDVPCEPDFLRPDRLIDESRGDRCSGNSAAAQHSELRGAAARLPDFQRALGQEARTLSGRLCRFGRAARRRRPSDRRRQISQEAAAGAEHASVACDVDVGLRAVHVEALMLLAQVHVRHAVVRARIRARDGNILQVGFSETEILPVLAQVRERDVGGGSLSGTFRTDPVYRVKWCWADRPGALDQSRPGQPRPFPLSRR
jgi:hypothetical protein